MSAFDRLHRKRTDLPPRIICHGPPKIGKTTLSNEFPNPIFLQTEDGENEDEISTFGKIESYDEFIQVLADLYTEPHDFKTGVVDSTTALEQMIITKVIEQNPTTEKGKPVKSIEDYGYGKGYVLVEQKWLEVIQCVNALRKDRKMAFIFIAHSNMVSISPPDGDPYKSYGLQLSNKGASLLEREFDLIIFLNTARVIKEADAGFGGKHKYATGTGAFVMMNMDRGNPAYTGGSRYNTPPTIRFDKGQGFAALAPYLPGFDETQAEAMGAVEQKDAA